MAGIYIHFPFCRHKCSYCNFYSSASLRLRDETVEMILKEIKVRKDYLSGETIDTIYFGGGTPSLLRYGELEALLEVIHTHFNTGHQPEITLEANPDDLTADAVAVLSKTSINRISVGIQSFREVDLRFLDRMHSASEADAGIKRLQDAGFENLSLDLIYGIPALSDAAWKENLLQAISLQVPHISAYALTIEEKTPLFVHIKKGVKPDVDENTLERHFKILRSTLKESGYQHYEISNFALPGKFARHNTAYWQGKKYLGAGPSAHSFDGASRQWNVSNIPEYVKSLSTGIVPFEKEFLSLEQHFNEYVMTSIRTMWGCNTAYIEDRFGAGWKTTLLEEVAPFIRNNLAELDGNSIKLTGDGMFRADGIAAALFRV